MVSQAYLCSDTRDIIILTTVDPNYICFAKVVSKFNPIRAGLDVNPGKDLVISWRDAWQHRYPPWNE